MLHIAVSNEDKDMAEILLVAGADVNAQNRVCFPSVTRTVSLIAMRPSLSNARGDTNKLQI